MSTPAIIATIVAAVMVLAHVGLFFAFLRDPERKEGKGDPGDRGEKSDTD